VKDETKANAVAFLKATVACYANLGVTIECVMTDNGACYRSQTSARACKKLGLNHLRTKPYTPKTNGKAERFIPDIAARMGLRSLPQHFRRACRRTAQIALLQLAPASRRDKILKLQS
jgi:transposase InsO family protein